MKSIFLSFALALALAPCPARAATNTGHYKGLHEIDDVTVVQSFQAANYSRVAVQPIDTRNAPLPKKDDNTYNDVRAALGASTASFIDGMRSKIGGMQVGTGSGRPKALVVRARITKSDPGSQAARYWGGFGAGAAKIGIAGEIVDGGSGKVLVRFAQERRSGFGLFGGGYRELLDRTMRQIGGDVAGLIRAF
jgi:Domain of unknown function (DUF4410)